MVLLPALLAATTLLAGEIPLSVYQARRAQLRKELSDGVLVLFGQTERESGDIRSGFWQEPNFFYLTGWLEPGAVLLMEPSREALFLPRRNPEAEKWTGPKAAPGDTGIRARTGFDTVLGAEHLERELRTSLEQQGRIHAFKDTPHAQKLSTLAPFAEISDPRLAIARLRMKKSPEEIALIQHAVDVTVAAHRAAWKRAAPGLRERQLAATFLQVFLDNGCERPAYVPIIGSGPNSVYLHYSRNDRLMDRGELLLMDVGAECSGYAADVTRTIPLGGKFSKRQREIYEIVLGAQKAAIAAVKPGMTIGKTSPSSLYKVAHDYIDSRGKDLQGNPLGKYFTHGLSHHVGLEIHDAWDPSKPLQAGMVITVEPGIYIPEENIGVRIEDVVLVTENGARILSDALPREPGDIEKALGK